MKISDFSVRRVDAVGELPSVHALGRDTFSDESQCTPGAFWPSMRQLADALESGGAVYVASDRGRDVGFTVVDRDGRVTWLRAGPDSIAVVCAACCEASFRDFGACWGVVGSERIRRAAVAVAPALFVDEGPATRVLRYRP